MLIFQCVSNLQAGIRQNVQNQNELSRGVDSFSQKKGADDAAPHEERDLLSVEKAKKSALGFDRHGFVQLLDVLDDDLLRVAA